MTEVNYPKIGLALGGGGARGLAHIPMLEVFDDLGIRPAAISGTSIGSIIGGLYASGRSGSEIRNIIRDHFISRSDSLKDLFYKKKIFNALKFFDLAWTRTGLLKGDKVIQFLYDQMHASNFEELAIPLQVVATDYWTREQIVLDRGPLLPAIKASMGLPGIFMPVELQGRILVDGGMTNPVPYDLLLDTCDVVIAIDILGDKTPEKDSIPNAAEAIMGTFDIFQTTIVKQKLKQLQPTHYLRPKINNIDILSFDRSDEIYAQAESSYAELRNILESFANKSSRLN